MRVITYTFLFAVITCIIGCNNKKSSNPKKVFRYNEDGGITSLDPAFARTQANTWAVNMLFNGLVQLDEYAQVQPCVAKSWDISEDGRTYTFHLRRDVRFHDCPAFGSDEERARWRDAASAAVRSLQGWIF